LTLLQNKIFISRADAKDLPLFVPLNSVATLLLWTVSSPLNSTWGFSCLTEFVLIMLDASTVNR
jgi:hypothetical protein